MPQFVVVCDQPELPVTTCTGTEMWIPHVEFQGVFPTLTWEEMWNITGSAMLFFVMIVGIRYVLRVLR